MNRSFLNKWKTINIQNNGFTLIEIMLVVAILGIFLNIVYSFLGFNLKFLQNRNEDSASYLQARVAMLRLTTDFQSFQTLIDTGGIIQGTDGSGITTKLMNYNNVTDSSCKYYLTVTNTSTGISQLNKSVNVVAENIKITILPLPSDLIKITIQGFQDDNSTESTVNLSTIIRLEHKRIHL